MSLYDTKDSEWELISLFSRLTNPQELTYLYRFLYPQPWENIVSRIVKIIHVVISMDLDVQPKPESKLMSLITQTTSLFRSMDLNSQPKPLMELISLTIFIYKYSKDHYGLEDKLVSDFKSLVIQTLELKPEPELISLIHQILSLVISINSKWEKLISLSPQVQVMLSDGKFVLVNELEWRSNHKWNCFLGKLEKFRLDDVTTRSCNIGEYEEAPVEVKHPLHPKHYLQLVFKLYENTRKCYCCDEVLTVVFYCCLACDYAMHIACVEKPQVLYNDHPKWHEHTLALFPRGFLLTCNLCDLADSTSPIYMCPPCDFVAHRRCLNLPRVIRISRHPHRIRYTQSFEKGIFFCGVCRKNINNDYGGYSCMTDGCSYAAHSRCATQSNVCDGIDLEDVPEEIEEEMEPFLKIKDGITRHCMHEHDLRLDENMGTDYDETKYCQACITSIYFGKFYSCMHCEFVLHETCAKLSRKIYHPIHPHKLALTIVGGNKDVMGHASRCSACYRLFTSGLFYKCGIEECCFQLHVQCATVSEPLLRASHPHRLFLTSKPEEGKLCSVCFSSCDLYTNETFNCIECECDFAMCFRCASIPQKVRYKHDKHILTLSYGENTSTITDWCEVCEGQIKPRKGFYVCGENCCVTLHIKCLIGRDMYIKPGSSALYCGKKVDVLPNNKCMYRPTCSKCEKRCPQQIVFSCYGSKLCSVRCLLNFFNIRHVYV